MRPHRFETTVLSLLASVAILACGDANESGRGEVPRSDFGSRGEAASTRAKDLPDAVDLDEAARPLRFAVGARSGYVNADGVFVLDVLEGDSVYPSLVVRDAERRPVRGVRPTITPRGDSRVILLGDEDTVSDDAGEYRFGLLGGTMGEERVDVVFGEDGGSLLLNVISQRAAAGYGWMDEIEGALDWDLLFQAQVEYGDDQLTASFPDEISRKSGQTVKLAGFMMPLETTTEQSHFVLTSSPPGCYFHLPGGPAGAVEVFATKPIEVGWEPVVLEGRFEAVAASADGVVYRLHDARSVDVAKASPGA